MKVRSGCESQHILDWFAGTHVCLVSVDFHDSMFPILILLNFLPGKTGQVDYEAQGSSLLKCSLSRGLSTNIPVLWR